METLIQIALYMGFFLGIIAGVVLLFILLKSVQFKAGKKRVHEKYPNRYDVKIKKFGTVKNLSVTPIIDYYSVDPEFRTEPGVSYWIEADNTTILLDTGFNKKKEHPSPLIHNLNRMGKSLEDIDMIFFSHLHLDHVGGMKEQKKKEFSFSAGSVPLPDVPVYSPEPIRPSEKNPAGDDYRNIVLTEPEKIKAGIASTGVVARYFVLGETLEHGLAINVKGKGLVIIVGCGHQTMEKILEMAEENFNEPVYGIIGGLHYPVKNGRIMLGPLNLQGIAATENSPFSGITESQLENAIRVVKEKKIKLLALSAHDSSDYAMGRFQEEIPSAYRPLKVGETVRV